jgi:hypothetical protein
MNPLGHNYPDNMKTNKPTAEMDDAEFERYLKRNKITGMAALAAAAKRRAAIKNNRGRA